MNPQKQVKMMDSGTVRFNAEGGLSGALNKVMTEMGKEGGTVRREGEDSAVLDASDAWRNRFITARVEPSGNGFAASFREGNSLSRTGRIVSWSVSFILIASILAFFGSWWRLPCCLCIAALLFYVLTAPEDACRRRMQRIIHELGQ